MCKVLLIAGQPQKEGINYQPSHFDTLNKSNVQKENNTQVFASDLQIRDRSNVTGALVGGAVALKRMFFLCKNSCTGKKYLDGCCVGGKVYTIKKLNTESSPVSIIRNSSSTNVVTSKDMDNPHFRTSKK